MNRDTSSDGFWVLQSAAYNHAHSPVIRVVFDEDHEYFVRQDLITARSEFFKKAMHGDWKEARERKVEFLDDEVATFGLYLQLLYAEKLPVLESEILSSADIAKEHIALSKLYVLAERLIDETIKTILLGAVTARSKIMCKEGIFCYPGLDAVRTIYDGTPPSSPARQLLVQLYTDFQGPDSLIKARSGPDSDNVPKEFLFDLSISLLGTRVLSAQHRRVEATLDSIKSTLSEMEESIRRHLDEV